MSPRPVQLTVTGNSASAVNSIEATERELRELNRTARHTDSVLSGVKRGLVAIGGAAIVGTGLRAGIGLIKESVTLASDLAETQSKVGTVFGKSAKGITEWARTTDAAMAMSQRAILDTVTGFDLLLTNRGLGASAAKSMSKELTTLAADLSSFFNTSAQDAADALSSALRGETDPIERFGVSLDEATLKARAYAMGLYSGKGALSATAKAQAAYAEIVRQTSKAQGDLGRTQGSAANQMRQFKINVEGLKTTLGTAFTPLIERYLPGINDWLKDINSQETAEKLGRGLMNVADIIETRVFPKLRELGKSIKDAFKGVDSKDAEGALTALGTAAENIAKGVGAVFEAFGNLSPEAQANIATIVAAGTALTVLTRGNPVIKIGVGLAADVIGTVATAVINRVIQGTQPVRITGQPIKVTGTVATTGDGGDDGRRRGRGGPTLAGGLGRAGVAALIASMVPSIVDRLPVPQGVKNYVNDAAPIAAYTAMGFSLFGPIGGVGGFLFGAFKTVGDGYKGLKVEQQRLTAHSTYLTGQIEKESKERTKADGIAARSLTALNTSTYLLQQQDKYFYRENRHRISDLEVEKGSRRRTDDELKRENRHRISDLEIEKGSRRSADATEARRRKAGDDALWDELSGEEKRRRTLERRIADIVGAPASVTPQTAAASTRTAAVVNNYTFNVSGSASPEQTAREIERRIRRTGDRARVSVGAP